MIEGSCGVELKRRLIVFPSPSLLITIFMTWIAVLVMWIC